MDERPRACIIRPRDHVGPFVKGVESSRPFAAEGSGVLTYGFGVSADVGRGGGGIGIGSSRAGERTQATRL